jgi:hypothetical protein
LTGEDLAASPGGFSRIPSEERDLINLHLQKYTQRVQHLFILGMKMIVSEPAISTWVVPDDKQKGLPQSLHETIGAK